MPGLRSPWLSAVVASTMILTFPDLGTAQTKSAGKITFENLTRETWNLRDVTVEQADGTKKTYDGPWNFRPGERAYLSSKDVTLMGCRVHYTVVLLDGTKGNWTSTNKELLDGELLLQSILDDDLASARKDDKGRKLTKAEATYRYWNAVHGIHLEETFDAVQDVGFLEISKAAGYIRTMAERIEDLDTTNVDDDAVAAAKSLAEVLRRVVKVLQGRNLGNAAVLIGELYQLKVDKLGKILDENQMIAGKTEDLFQFMRSRKKALEKRYDVEFPYLIPPVGVGLSEFPFSKGYYVNVLNTSGSDLKDVKVRYRDVEGTVKYQTVKKRLTFDAAASLFDFTRVDPDDIEWTVERGEWITIEWEGGAYSYPTSKLIKK